jgi:TonB family protein
MLCLLLACCFAPLWTRGASSGDRQPVLLVRVHPDFPFEMKREGLPGSATVALVIETDGTVNWSEVVEATHPAFGAAAAACVLKWKFEPKLKDGRPVRCTMVQSLKFNIDPVPKDWANTKTEIKDPVSVKPGDVAPRVVTRINAQYTRKLVDRRVSGSVIAEYSVTQEGIVEGIRIIEATDKLLEPFVKNCLSHWRFVPPLRNGLPVRMKLRQVFTFTCAQTLELPSGDTTVLPSVTPSSNAPSP